ncbi:MAG: hypothetical protein RBT37_00865 [Dissulfurispiraceae bacterium]|nr:hypothetical protein [Dissulfurispiraceae bacterium]
MTEPCMEKRKTRRKTEAGSSRYFIYCDRKHGVCDCVVRDSSSDGFGIICDCCLKQGQIVIIKSEEPASVKSAVVQWCRQSDGRYKAGLCVIN